MKGLCDHRRQLKQQKYTSTEAGLEYRKVNRDVGKEMKAAKEKGTMSGNSKEAYNTLRAFTSGNILTERTAILNRWTEYWSGLYNYELYLDTSLLQSNQTPTQEAECLPVFGEKVEEAVHNLKTGKSPGVDNIPSELPKNGEEATIQS